MKRKLSAILSAVMLCALCVAPASALEYCQRQPENVDFRRNRMSFFGGQHSGVYSPYTQSHLLA